MKQRTLLSIFSLCLLMNAFAQKHSPDQNKNKKSRFYVGPIGGGSINLSFGDHYHHFGCTPYLGSSLSKSVDLAGSFGVNFIKNISNNGINIDNSQTSFGPGAFVRVFPISFLYLQGQYEFNFIEKSYTVGGVSQTDHLDANSFLLGAGINTGRNKMKSSYFYFSVLWDVADDPHSPYKDQNGHAVPVIRTGFNLSLIPPKKHEAVGRFGHPPMIIRDRVIRTPFRFHRRRRW